MISYFPIVMASCALSQGGQGNQAGDFISLTSAGLESLAHYQATLNREIKATISANSIERSDQITFASWKNEKASFETLSTKRNNGSRWTMTAGQVDKAGYFLLDKELGCQVFWDEENIQVSDGDFLAYLYPLDLGQAAGNETINGIASRVYPINSDSLGLDGVEANGKVWLAVDGGFLVKYSLELTGGEALFGKGTTGTLTIEYELSEVNDGSSVEYPPGCSPVLLDIPAMENAQEVQRLPGWLSYRSTSSPSEIQGFYETFFSSQEWSKTNVITGEDSGLELFFSRESDVREAVVSLRTDGSSTLVDVTTNDSAPETPGSTPEPSGATGDPTTLVFQSLIHLLGQRPDPGKLPSYAMVVDEVLPAASGQSVRHVEAEVAGTNKHYTMTVDGQATEAYQMGQDYYEVIGGQVKPGLVLNSIKWDNWQNMDLVMIFSAASTANPQAAPGTTLEGRAVDVFTVQKEDVPGSGLDGFMPLTVLGISGEVWIDHETGALLKADLEFTASVKKGSKPAVNGPGSLLIVVSRIGKVTVSLP